MSDVHRYKVVKMLSETGNQISYDPHGPDVVVASAYDQLKAELVGLRTGFDAQNEVIAGLKKDADRYRWLRENWFTMASEYNGRVAFITGRPRWSDLPESSVDAAIDAAMGKGGEA